jgi:hypothetical protein
LRIAGIVLGDALSQFLGQLIKEPHAPAGAANMVHARSVELDEHPEDGDNERQSCGQHDANPHGKPQGLGFNKSRKALLKRGNIGLRDEAVGQARLPKERIIKQNERASHGG